MTEQDAKDKTCPISLIPVSGGDDSPAFISPNSCIGSACMAWRWEREELESGTPGYTRRSPTDGFCGLAGKP